MKIKVVLVKVLFWGNGKNKIYFNVNWGIIIKNMGMNGMYVCFLRLIFV